MKKKSKRYQESLNIIGEGSFSLEEAASKLKALPKAKFDETIELSFKLDVDPRKTDQRVRGFVSLPNGSGKEVKIIVFAQGEQAEKAKKLGVTKVGLADLIKEIQDGFLDFDVAIATPDAMKEVRKIARILGPRGLMPAPQTRTVTDDVSVAIEEAKAGKVDYKMDKYANVAVVVGKLSFTEQQLVENAQVVIDSIIKSRPAAVKGVFIGSLSIASTMSPGIKLNETIYRV